MPDLLGHNGLYPHIFYKAHKGSGRQWLHLGYITNRERKDVRKFQIALLEASAEETGKVEFRGRMICKCKLVL